MNFARPSNPMTTPPARRTSLRAAPAPPLEHPMPDLNGTLFALLGLAITALLSNGELGSTMARTASYGVAICIAISFAFDVRLNGITNLIRADIMAIVSLYFLTLFEFLFPQPKFDTMAGPHSTHQALLCVLLAFAGLFAGRHLLHPKRQPFEETLNREIPASWIVGMFWGCMIIGYAHQIIAVEFNFQHWIEWMMEERFAQPWQRGRLGDWKALLVELGLFIYLIPPLGGVMIARRRRYSALGLATMFIGLAITFFYGITSGTRSIFAAYLITFLIGYAFALPSKDRKELILLCAGCGVLMVIVSSQMLKFREIGLRRYLTETADPNKVSEVTYFVDYNIYNICLLTDVFPAKRDYLGWEVPYLALVRPIPRAIWKGKPEGMSITIEDIVGAEGWTVSATFAGEAYMSGGFIAVGIIALVFGALTGWWSHLASVRNSELGILIYSSGFFATVISMRSLFVFTTALLPTIAALVMGTYVVRALASHAQRLLAVATVRNKGRQRMGLPPGPRPPARPSR